VLTFGRLTLASGGERFGSAAELTKSIAAALEDPAALPDLWPLAVDAGWSGLLIGEEHGGADLGAFDALLVAKECGRVLPGCR
jgi:alkylation response protein AidB-like acyl-CoA dehydrogenase